VRGLSPQREPLIRHGLRPRHLLPQGEKEGRSVSPDPDEIEGRTDKVKGLVLRTESLTKA